jgi:hypothetical protein
MTACEVIDALKAAGPGDAGPFKAGVYCLKHHLHGANYIGPKVPRPVKMAEVCELCEAVSDSPHCDERTASLVESYHEVALQWWRVRKSPKAKHEWKPTEAEVVQAGHLLDGALNRLLRRLGRQGGNFHVAEVRRRPDLTNAEQAVWDVLGNGPLKGEEIAERAGYAYGYIRQLLPRLKKRRVLARVRAGYERA